MKAKPVTFPIIAIFLAALMFGPVKGDLDMTIEDERCNEGTYSHKDPYELSAFNVLLDLLRNTESSAGMDLRTQSSDNDNISYGHGSCVTELTVEECSACITHAYATLTTGCALKVGGRVFLRFCSIRYENYYFTDK